MGLDEMNVPQPRDIAAKRGRSYWLLGAGLMVLYVALRETGWQGNGQLHTLMEGAATILALVVGAMALVRYATKRSATFLFIGTGFLGTAMLDGYHAVVTSSFFAQYLPSELSSLIPWSWVASRLFLSTMMCLSWFAWQHEQRYGGEEWISVRKVYVVAGFLTLASFLFFAFVPLPRAYYPEYIFHRPEEFIPAALFALAIIGYWRKGLWRTDEFEHCIMLSLVVGFISQAGIMSLSGGLFDAEFDAAHFLKAASYVVVLGGLFKSMSSIFRQAEDRAANLHGIVTTAHDGILSIDERGIVTSFNPAASGIFGYDAGDVIGENVSMLMSGADHNDHDAYVRNYLETGQKKIIGIGREVRGRRKDGSLFPLDLSISEMSISGRRAFTGIVRDISERNQAEELAEKRSVQLALINSIAVGANEIEDLDEFIQLCVDRICEFTGWPVGHVYRVEGEEERLLQSTDIWHLEDPERFKNFQKITEETSLALGVGLPGRVANSGKPDWIVDVTLDSNFPRAQKAEDIGVHGASAFPVNVGGECVMVLEFYSSSVEEIDQELLSAIAATSEQISRRVERERTAQELRRAREESQEAEFSAVSASVRAEAANLAKSDFLDNMSHELRTPLNGMLGFADMLESESLGPLGNEQYAEYVKIIGNSGRHLLSVINDVLDYSKIETGKIELDPVPFDLSQLTEGVVELLAASAHEKRIDIGCFIDPEVPTALTGDQSRLRQILLNLMGNAVKFTESGGVRLEVSLETDTGCNTCLRFEISDTGIGIEDHVQEKLFEKFIQADASTTRKFGGSGLGLAISKHLVSLMGGEIGVVSELGSGSVFWFTAVLPTRTESREDAKEKVAGYLRGQNVLLVDDNHVNLLICRQHLEALGSNVFEAGDAHEALALLAEASGEHFELAIIDHMMAGIDGIELGALIREQSKYDSLKMVLSSSSGQVVSHRNARDLGFNAALPKPLHQTAVLNCFAGLYGISLAGVTGDGSSKPSIVSPASRSLQCLMAEDNNVNQLLLKTMLSDAGHQVDIAQNGHEAVLAAQENSYDVILMDVHMPLMNGLEATRQIRQLPGAAGRVPILAVTAAAMSKDKDKCFLAGMNDFISKPIDRDQLFRKIAFWTGMEESSVAPIGEARNDDTSVEIGEDAAGALDAFLDSVDGVSDAAEEDQEEKQA